VRLGLAQLYELDGRYEDGLELLEDALRRRPPAPSVTITAARLLRRLGRGDESLSLLDGMDRLPKGHPEAARLEFVRGDLLHEQGRYPEAFHSYQRANRAKGPSFDPAAFYRGVEALVAFFTPERVASLPQLDAAEERPVFIVGMPRSGTTVLEQILGAHAAVAPLGERPDLFRAVRSFTRSGEVWPTCLAECGADRLEAIAQRYLADPRIEPGHRRVIDKMPGNVLHLGLVAMLFPGARVIEARRDPMDAGWSCFSQDFQAESLDYSRDLGHIGYYYRGMQRLLEHWRQVLPLSFTAVEHERLVAEPEHEIRRLLDFLRLPWQSGLLDFHRQAPASITASYFQVREPLNARGIGRHRPYAAFLAPLADALARPWHAQAP
jgi:tetratricopeptide (TPR) repeat protein